MEYKYYITFYDLGEFKIVLAEPHEWKAVSIAVEKCNYLFRRAIAEGTLEPVSEEDIAAIEKE